jgi:hypothetical protein
MRAAGFRPATPALAKMLEIGTDHACDAVGQHTPVGLPSPQSLLLSSTIDATGRCSQDLPGRHQASNRHRARCGRVLSLPRLRALQVCRRRPTLGVAAASTAGIRKPSQVRTHALAAKCSFYSITSSARSRIDCGIVSSSSRAALRLTTSSNFVGCSIGKSAGLAPFRILSTVRTARRTRSLMFVP